MRCLESQFKLLSPDLGKGAFGSVYTCRKNFGRKKYAAKVVEFGDDNKIKWQTENEIDVSVTYLIKILFTTNLLPRGNPSLA